MASPHIAPKISASLSIFGSSYILYDALVRSSNNGLSTYHRLMIGLSISDLLMSIGLFTSTLPMPSDTPDVQFAVGNTQKCAAVGFLEQAGVAAVMYNASLSTYYLLRIRYGWPTSKLVQAEKWALHSIPIVFGLGTMIASLALGLFNSGLFDCWIAPFPQECTESWRSVNGDSDCIRGDHASLYQWVFDVIPKWLSVLLVTINMWFRNEEPYAIRSPQLLGNYHPA
jgi:hypothetical protein